MPRPSEKGHTRDSAVYSLRLKGELHAQWEEYCAKADRKPADTIRALMRYMMRGDMPPEVEDWLYKQVEAAPETGIKKRVGVNFTQSEYEGIKARAEAEAVSIQRWVINCVRASLTQEPQFTMAALEKLDASIFQLQGIGRNLNQMAKAMHQGKASGLAQESYEKLSGIIYKHIDKVVAVHDASLLRWGIQK